MTPEERAEKFSDRDFLTLLGYRLRELFAAQIREAVEEEVRERLANLEYAKVRDAKTEAYEDAAKIADQHYGSCGEPYVFPHKCKEVVGNGQVQLQIGHCIRAKAKELGK